MLRNRYRGNWRRIMKIRFLATVAIFSILGTQAQAGDKSIYLKAVGGGTFETQQFWGGTYYPMDMGYNFGAAAGYYLSPNFSLEADVFHTSAQYTTYRNSLNSTSLMANAVLHSGDSMPVDFYAGLGVGMVNLNYHNVAPYDYNEWTFGGQALVGASLPVTDNVSILAEYRYQVAGNTTGTSRLYGYNSHNVSVGLEFKF
jgi:opacity protein-like surface antigen